MPVLPEILDIITVHQGKKDDVLGEKKYIHLYSPRRQQVKTQLKKLQSHIKQTTKHTNDLTEQTVK